MVAMFLGINRVYLEDDARIMDNKLDLTLLTVMRDEQTVYEKYGYRVCNFKDHNTINLAIHKKLLRHYNFQVFVFLLKDDDAEVVRKVMKRSGMVEGDIKHLHEFYTKADEYYDKRVMSDSKRVRLQRILLDEEYPWYSMVDVIRYSKQCMEKLYD
jgi:hypothetical protein